MFFDEGIIIGWIQTNVKPHGGRDYCGYLITSDCIVVVTKGKFQERGLFIFMQRQKLPPDRKAFRKTNSTHGFPKKALPSLFSRRQITSLFLFPKHILR
jgi:hypothetical protein